MRILWFSKSRRAQTETDYETWVKGGVVPTLNAFDRGDGREVTVILQNQESVSKDTADTCLECGNDDSTENQVYCMDCLESGAKELNEAIIFQDSRRDGVRIQKDVMNTLEAHIGTGGNNVPIIFTQNQREEVRDLQGLAGALNADSGSHQTNFLAFPIQGTSIGRSDNAGPQGKGFGDADDPMFTLDSGAGANAVANTSTVRRLTPVEWERLQGFPDRWTECVSDSQRYKQMGNAVTVNVVAWIGGNL